MNWRKASRIALLLSVVSALAPLGARAEDPPPMAITNLEVFGDSRTDLTSTFWDDTKVLFASSDALGNGQKGYIYVRGHISNGHVSGDVLRDSVSVTVSDGVMTLAPRAGADITRVGAARGDFAAELQVTELGKHHVDFGSDGKPVAGLDPAKFPTDAAYLAKLGASPLTVKIEVVPPAGGGDKVVETTTITKYAGTPRDAVLPQVSPRSWPPSEWCHMPDPQVQFPIFIGTFGASYGCGTNTPQFTQPTGDAIIGGCPDSDKTDAVIVGPVRVSPCKIVVYGATGTAGINGSVNTNPNAVVGASEISDITVEITQGSRKVMFGCGPSRQTLHHALTYHAGSSAGWASCVRIDDLEPNFPVGDPYVVTVVVTDAWGRQVIAKSSDITVYPF